MCWYSETTDGTILNVHIVPRSSKNEICGLHGHSLKIKVQAPPDGGKANKALIKYLASAFSITQNQIAIVSGKTSRMKILKIQGISPADAKQILSVAAG